MLNELLTLLLGKRAPATRRQGRQVRPWLEELESRLTPVVDRFWSPLPMSNHLASNPANWAGGVLPGAGDSLIFSGANQTPAVIDIAFINQVFAMVIDP